MATLTVTDPTQELMQHERAYCIQTNIRHHSKPLQPLPTLEGQHYASIELTTYQRVDSEASQTVTIKQSMRYSGGPITACKSKSNAAGKTVFAMLSP
jgi:hypothetical protein